jgi:hypothetical protein
MGVPDASVCRIFYSANFAFPGNSYPHASYELLAIQLKMLAM